MSTQDADRDGGFFVESTDAPPASGIPAPDTTAIDWRRVHAGTRFRATPTSLGLVGRLLLVAPPWAYTASLIDESLSGSYRAFGYSYDGLILGITALWTGAVFTRSRVGRGR